MSNSFPTICETTVKTKTRIYGVNHWEECLVKQFINIQVSFTLGPQPWIESNTELLNWEQGTEMKCGWLLRAGEMLLAAEKNFFCNSQGIMYFKRCWRWIEIRDEKLKPLENLKITFTMTQIIVSYNNNGRHCHNNSNNDDDNRWRYWIVNLLIDLSRITTDAGANKRNFSPSGNRHSSI